MPPPPSNRNQENWFSPSNRNSQMHRNYNVMGTSSPSNIATASPRPTMPVRSPVPPPSIPPLRTRRMDSPSVRPPSLPPPTIPPTSWINVGKVRYDKNAVLGMGCEGTVVYRGDFGGREVAVKRVITEVLTPVVREVELLRESDSHHNIVRYFATEFDSNFHYIILELCLGSMYDYVEKSMRVDISSKEILRQTTEGIAFLHSINIVHRDLKPQNVLISKRGGVAKVVISDFGGSKRLQPGRHSLSNTNGPAGTDGWIAPEELKGHSTSFPMDIFSLGCVYYYVLTEGYHPFGEAGNYRNFNIFSGQMSLEKLNTEKSGLCKNMISHSIAHSPNDRPSARALIRHPFFWDVEKQLTFFCEASDRLVAENFKSILSKRIETNGFIGITWTDAMCESLRKYLTNIVPNGKYRPYKIGSVRDLLRAIRNMKHHYRELPVDVRSALEEVEGGLVAYFTSRFPELHLHVYEAMKLCSEEEVFRSYYNEETRVRLNDDVPPGRSRDHPTQRNSNAFCRSMSLEKMNAEYGSQWINFSPVAHPTSPANNPSITATVVNPDQPHLWNAEKQLAFLCAASDRLVVDRYNTPLSKRIEKNGINGTVNWMEKICDTLKQYLTNIDGNERYRPYKTTSVRDLLRVMRNMKYNYSSLPLNVCVSLGEIPDGLLLYFTSRFPELLLHVYDSMKLCSEEEIFRPYYKTLANLVTSTDQTNASPLTEDQRSGRSRAKNSTQYTSKNKKRSVTTSNARQQVEQFPPKNFFFR